MKKLFLAIASLIISGCSDYEIEEYNMLCACGSVYAMSYPTTEDVEIITTLDHFDARPIDGGDWINCNCSDTYVHVNVHENKSTDDREGLVEVFNDKYNLRDTIRVFQQGVYVPSGGGNSGGSGSGGGSGTNVTKRRCAAKTKKGTRCKRTAAKGSIYCWQHKR